VDFRKCQTSTASPAEPGELPVGLAGERDDLFEIAEGSADMFQPFTSPGDHNGTLPCGLPSERRVQDHHWAAAGGCHSEL